MLEGELGARFELVRPLGEGAAATVLLVRPREPAGADPLALKILRATVVGDDTTRRRFLREAEVGKGFTSPRVLPVVEAGIAEGRAFLLSPYMPGGSLRELLREGAPSPGRARRLAREIAEGLGVLHAAGVVHRDVKPENVLLDGEGRAVLADLGLATGARHGPITETGMVLGTPVYMAPEVCRGEAPTPESDIYSVGCVLYELLEGRAPFSGALGEVLMAKATGAADPADPAREGALMDLALACLEPEPSDRPALAEVEAVLVEEGSGEPRTTARLRASAVRSARRRAARATRPHAAVGRGEGRRGRTLLALALGAGLGWGSHAYLWRSHATPGPAPSSPVLTALAGPAPPPAPGESPPAVPRDALARLKGFRDPLRLATHELLRRTPDHIRYLTLTGLQSGLELHVPAGLFKIRWGATRDGGDPLSARTAEALREEIYRPAELFRGWLDAVLRLPDPPPGAVDDVVDVYEATKPAFVLLEDGHFLAPAPSPPEGAAPWARRLWGYCRARWLGNHHWAFTAGATPARRAREDAAAVAAIRELETPPLPDESLETRVDFLDVHQYIAGRAPATAAAAAARLRPLLAAAEDPEARLWFGALLAGVLPYVAAADIRPGDLPAMLALRAAWDRADPRRFPSGEVRVTIRAGLHAARGGERWRGLSEPDLYESRGIERILSQDLVDRREGWYRAAGVRRQDRRPLPLEELDPADLPAWVPDAVRALAPRNYPTLEDILRRAPLVETLFRVPPPRLSPGDRRARLAELREVLRVDLWHHLEVAWILRDLPRDLDEAEAALVAAVAERFLDHLGRDAHPLEEVWGLTWALRAHRAPGGDHARAMELARRLVDRFVIGGGVASLRVYPWRVHEAGEAIDALRAAGVPGEDADIDRLRVALAPVE